MYPSPPTPPPATMDIRGRYKINDGNFTAWETIRPNNTLTLGDISQEEVNEITAGGNEYTVIVECEYNCGGTFATIERMYSYPIQSQMAVHYGTPINHRTTTTVTWKTSYNYGTVTDYSVGGTELTFTSDTYQGTAGKFKIMFVWMSWNENILTNQTLIEE